MPLERDDVGPDKSDSKGWTPLLWAALNGQEGVAVFPTGQVGQAAAKPSLAYGNSPGPGLARAYRLCKA